MDKIPPPKIGKAPKSRGNRRQLPRPEPSQTTMAGPSRPISTNPIPTGPERVGIVISDVTQKQLESRIQASLVGKTLKEAEKILKNALLDGTLTREIAIQYDYDGQMCGSPILGDKGTVKIEKEDYPNIILVAHDHPNAISSTTIDKGMPLSMVDFLLCRVHNLNEIRAVTSYGVFSAVRTNAQGSSEITDGFERFNKQIEYYDSYIRKASNLNDGEIKTKLTAFLQLNGLKMNTEILDFENLKQSTFFNNLMGCICLAEDQRYQFEFEGKISDLEAIIENQSNNPYQTEKDQTRGLF